MIKKMFVFVVTFSLLLSSMLVTGGGGTRNGELSYSETEIILVSLEGENDVTNVESVVGKIIEKYPNRALVEIPGDKLDSTEIHVYSTLPARTEVSVKGHRFDIDEGMPDFSDELTIQSYESGEEGLYLIHILGPVHTEWREKLEDIGVDIINYVPNYAYEVQMTPEQAVKVEDIYFVDWVGIYQPGFKLAEDLEPGTVSISMADGSRVIKEVEQESEFIEIARDNEVYYISNRKEKELGGEQQVQIIGGGWPGDDPTEPYRELGDYGSYFNQIGYEGEGITITIADSGLGDGTVGDAGHPDFTGRVIGGHFWNADNWTDRDGHGTHVAGSAAGNTHEGTGHVYPGGDTGPYYAGQGMAPEAELFSAKIFGLDEDGNTIWTGPADYFEIVEEPSQQTDTYIHSNSWGFTATADLGRYLQASEDYDRAVRDSNRDTAENEPMVIVVAAMNEGPSNQTVASPGNAKNVISVASTHNWFPDLEDHTHGPIENTSNPDIIAEYSGRGWTDDNRIKPDVAAPGHFVLSALSPDADDDLWSYDHHDAYYPSTGTSMATPAVSGAAALVVEWYEENYDTTPSPAMVRAILINTAEDMEEEGPIPNKKEGWGRVNLENLVPPDEPIGIVFEDQESLLTTGDVNEYGIHAEDLDEPLKITLTWTDEESSAGNVINLINNLDLEVVSPGGDRYRGNAFDDGWTQPNQNAMGDFDSNGDGWDDRNNVQNVYIHPDQLEGGEYTVRVIGENIPADANNDGLANQDYALMVRNTPAVNITAPGDATEPYPGDYTYSFDVENMGRGEDTYDLIVNDTEGWDVNVQDSVDVGAGETAQVAVEVTIPDEAGKGMTSTITLEGTSQSYPNVNDSNSMDLTLWELMDKPWPKFRYDLRNTGRSPVDTSFIDGTEKWNISTIGAVVSSPIIGEDGTIYVGSQDNNLYAFYPNGTERWNFTTGNSIPYSPAIGEDRTIYASSTDTHLYAVNPNGSEEWNFTTSEYINTSPVVGDNGTIFLATAGGLYAVNPEGTERWNLSFWSPQTHPPSVPAIGDDGIIYVSSRHSGEGYGLTAVNPDGTIKWIYITGPTYGYQINTSPAIGEDGTIYISFWDRIHALNPDGTRKWNITMDRRISSSPAIGEDGTIYFPGWGGDLYALNPNGTERWTFTAEDQIRSSPAIGRDGTIYFGSSDWSISFYALNPDGTKKWTYDTGGNNVHSSPAIGEDGTLYFGSRPFTTVPTFHAVFFMTLDTTAPLDAVETSSGTYNYSFDVENLGFENDTYDLQVSETEGWDVSVQDSVSVDTGDTVQIDVEVIIPDYTEVGDMNTITLESRSQNYTGVIDSVSMNITLGGDISVEVTGPTDQTETSPGAYTYEFDVKNTGNVDDTYELDTSDTEGWSVDVQDTVSVDVGETESVTVEVNIPNHSRGITNTITLSATSQTDNEVSSSDSMSVILELDEELEPAYFEVEITDYDDEVEEGNTITVEFTVENTGDLEDTQDIIFSVDGTEEDSMEVTLDGGEGYSGEFFLEAEDTGDYELEVASEDTSDSVAVTVKGDEEIPGFTSILLLVAVITAVLIYKKKKR